MALTKFNYNSFDVTPVASKALAFNSDADGLTTAAEGSMVLIKELTASSSATLSFVDGASDVVLDSTYPTYLFKFINIHPQTNGEYFEFNMSVDTGSNYNVAKTTSTFYAGHNEDNGYAVLTYIANQHLSQGTGFQHVSYSLAANNDSSVSGELWLFNPSDTTFVKHFTSTTNEETNGPRSTHRYTGGYGNTTSAVDAVRFQMTSGNIDSGTIKLYGIKDSLWLFLD